VKPLHVIGRGRAEGVEWGTQHTVYYHTYHSWGLHCEGCACRFTVGGGQL